VYPAFSRPATDVLVMNNGDRLTCEVKTLEAGVLQVNLDYVDGTISIDWRRVARMESQALFLLELQDGTFYSGKVISPETLAGTPVKLEIQAAGQESVVVDNSSVVRMTQFSESFLRRLSGNINIGATYSKGNNTTQYNFGSGLYYQQTRWGSRLTYNSNLSASTGAPTATRNQVDFSAYRLLRWKNYFYAGNVGFLQSSVQGIDRQTNLGVGVGRYLKNTNHVRFSLTGGIGWQRTNYTSTNTIQGTQNIGVALVSSNLDVFTFKKTRLDLSANVLPALTQPGRLFSRINASYYLKLFGKIDWNFSFYGNWDTQPPAHLPSSDYGSSTGLSWNINR
jgi:hypothetical protein